MSILIQGMEMPHGDDEMLCINIYPDGNVTINLDPQCKRIATAISVPPHGDLIDRNKLYEKTAEWEAQALHMVEVTMHDEDTTEWRKWSTVLTERSAFKFDVADAPTIIPAEPAEEGE